MKHLKKIIATSLIVAFASTSAHADIVQADDGATYDFVDYKSEGDKLIIKDLGTGLEWLKLTETFNMSADDVLANSEFSDADFRIATTDEVYELAQSGFAIPLITPGAGTERVRSIDVVEEGSERANPTDNMIAALNIEEMSEFFYDASEFGYCKGTYSCRKKMFRGIALSDFDASEPYQTIFGQTENRGTSSHFAIEGYVYTSTFEASSFKYQNYGVFMVRDTEVTSDVSAPLIGVASLALLGLGGMRRKSK